MRAPTLRGDEEEFKPSISGRKPASSGKITLSKPRLDGTTPRVGTVVYAKLPSPSNQLAVVQASKHTSNPINHARYLDREGAGGDGERPYCFSHDAQNIKPAKEVEHWDRDEFHHRRILPIMAEGLDPEEYTRAYVARLEKDWETKLEYVASVHRNTAQTHIHIMIRGRDHLGRNLDIATAYSHQIEWRRASDAATELVGPRSTKQIAQTVLKEQEKIEKGMNHPDLDLKGGWKVSINVNRGWADPDSKAVREYMREQGIRYDLSFAKDKAEVLVASVGSYDRMQKVVKDLEDIVEDRLKPIENRYVIASGIVMNDSMTVKFSPKGDRDFSHITTKGVPILKEDAREIKDLPIEERTARALQFRDKADEVLMERYGEFYGGKERVSALERLRELSLEHTHEHSLQRKRDQGYEL